ncbi:3-hydroxyacyl-ACP dehydratase FabZ family protein [Paenibacillus tarimensis]|uniref:3-hydroxyacyl-ACP dehydratase FabZ family protein n=1 Tax=Paenibacillus tarimensis TaxID=416012 RepID=UPI001F2710A1|nr:hypothetical protein [Paenibacillus tarimensis]MCF2945185.1 hypothetical protein [Paenibacillus tarimensis]
MIDRIVEIRERSIKTIKLISASDYYIKGHFRTYSVYPGMLLLEGVKQSATLLASCQGSSCSSPVQAGLMEELTVRFLQPVIPGDTVLFEVKAGERSGDTGRVTYEGTGTVDGSAILRAAFTVPERNCVCTSTRWK